MIPAGYMYKLVSTATDDAISANVIDFYSVGACGAGISPFFTDYIPHWKHNGYWFFNSPDIMREIARDEGIDLSSMTLFYYELHDFELDQPEDGTVTRWIPVECSASFATDVSIPEDKVLAGYDVVEYACRNSPECSLLSCSDLAARFTLNSHCLFNTFDAAKAAVESGQFHACEPGPYRILAVYVIAPVAGMR